MFYLTRFCRICVRSCGPLIDIDAEDADAVKLSDKLRYVRAKMVISEEEHCRLMCYECVQNLRVSYLFQKQCTKADEILERYLNELTSECPGRKFVNSELKVTIVPIPHWEVKPEPQDVVENDEEEITCVGSTAVGANFNYNASISIRTRNKIPSSATNSVKPIRLRRRLKQEASFRISEAYKDRLRRLRRVCPRITKQQRCMLLKSLLTKSDHNSNSPVIPSRKSRKYVLYHSRQRNTQPSCTGKATKSKTLKNKMDAKPKGGLRDLLGFIKCYDFGFNVKDSDIKEQCNGSVIDRLENFSRTFFYNDFQAYRETILSLANDSESSDDDDDMLEPFDEEEDRLLWPECSLSDNHHYNNVTIKEETIDGDNVQIKEEPDNDLDNDILPSALVQACYEQDQSPERPAMPPCLKQKINQGFQHFMNKIKTNLTSQASELSDPATIVNHINRISVIPEASTSSLSSLDLLTRLTNSTRLAKGAPKSNAPLPTRCHLKCRTRGNRFINPQLMQQFQTRTFKCDTCNRSFKSPGYLHSHCTKMGH